MKIYRRESKENKKAIRLTSILLSMVMIGSGLALTGCSKKEQEPDMMARAETELSTEEPTEQNFVREYWPNYENSINELKLNLHLPECFAKDIDIVNDIVSVLKSQETDNNTLEYIKYYNVIYTSDKKICYNESDKKLQLVLDENGKNILREYCSFDLKEYEEGNCFKIKNTIIAYDSKENNLKFDEMCWNGLRHNYDNMPIYTFEQKDMYTKEGCIVTEKEFVHFETTNKGHFYASFDYYSDEDDMLTMYYDDGIEKQMEYYSNCQNFNIEFNKYFDNQDISKLDKCLENFYHGKKLGLDEYPNFSSTKKEKFTEYVLKK